MTLVTYGLTCIIASCWFVYTTTHCSLKAYCAILVRCSNFRHRASPRVAHPAAGRGNCGRETSGNFAEMTTSKPFKDLLHAVKLRHGTNGFTSPPKEGVLRIFFALKIRRLRPGVNPQTWVPKASTLPLDHRSHFTAAT